MSYFGVVKSSVYEAAAVAATLVAFKSVSDSGKELTKLITKVVGYVADKTYITFGCNTALGYLPAYGQEVKRGFALLTSNTFNGDSAGISQAAKDTLWSVAITTATAVAAYKLAHNSAVVNAATRYLNQGLNFAISKI